MLLRPSFSTLARTLDTVRVVSSFPGDQGHQKGDGARTRIAAQSAASGKRLVLIAAEMLRSLRQRNDGLSAQC